jgi:hypothetical protein
MRKNGKSLNSPARAANHRKIKENSPAVSIVFVKKESLAAIFDIEDLDPKYKFLAWLVTPEAERFPKNQVALAAVLKVNAVSISRWKQDPEFMDLVSEAARRLALEYAGGVMKALAESALSGKLYAIEMFMKYILRMQDPDAGPLVNVNQTNNKLEFFIGGKPAAQLPVGLLKPVALAATGGS